MANQQLGGNQSTESSPYESRNAADKRGNAQITKSKKNDPGKLNKRKWTPTKIMLDTGSCGTRKMAGESQSAQTVANELESAASLIAAFAYAEFVKSHSIAPISAKTRTREGTRTHARTSTN